MTRERPIIFSTPMVRAVVGGHKTQTRRVIVPQPQEPHDDPGMPEGPWRINDTLYVRETWADDNGLIRYRANEPDEKLKWKPSIFMPRRAARIFLKVNQLTTERLQEIGRADAVREGVPSVEDFHKLWDSLNRKRGFGWTTNPWVWVIDFSLL